MSTATGGGARKWHPGFSTNGIYQQRQMTRALSRVELGPVPVNGGPRPRVSVPDGTEEVTYSIELDLGGIEKIARKAASNRTEQSKCGAILVRILNRRRVS